MNTADKFCSISLSLAYARSLIARTSFKGIHTILITLIAILLAVGLVYIPQNMSFLETIKISPGASFALSFPATSYVWWALVIETNWGTRLDAAIAGADPLDILAYMGQIFSGWVAWVRGQVCDCPLLCGTFSLKGGGLSYSILSSASFTHYNACITNPETACFSERTRWTRRWDR